MRPHRPQLCKLEEPTHERHEPAFDLINLMFGACGRGGAFSAILACAEVATDIRGIMED
jgi:hypothetical protein